MGYRFGTFELRSNERIDDPDPVSFDRLRRSIRPCFGSGVGLGIRGSLPAPRSESVSRSIESVSPPFAPRARSEQPISAVALGSAGEAPKRLAYHCENMDYESFTQKVVERANLDSSQEALAATDATLRTLAERISTSQAEAVAADLSSQIARSLTDGTEEEAESFSADEFLERVRERERDHADLDQSAAGLHAQAVLATLAEEADGDAWRGVRTQLPAEYDRLLESG